MNKRIKLALVATFLLLSFASISMVSAANNTTSMNLTYSTYHGGNGTDTGRAVAVDNNGNTYITGSTQSSNFPTTTGAHQTTPGGGTDAFLSKFNSNGNLTYSTYLGGNGTEAGRGIAVDNNGNIYITGYTNSANFPTTTGAHQTTLGGGYDAFLSKFNSNGNLTYSTYLGGNSTEDGYGIAVDNNGNIYITGDTASSNFPTTTGANQTTYCGGTYDAFLSKFNSNGNLTYSTYLGGNSTDYGYGIAVDNNGNIYITGYTNSPNFPTTQTTLGGGFDAFLSKFNSNGNLTYSTYLGGTGADNGYGIAVDNNGNIYITGQTASSNFPTKDAYQTTLSGTQDVFLSKFNSTGNLIYSTYLGGNSSEQGIGIAVDNNGNIYITGSTGSSNFPTTTGANQTTFGGGGDIFISKFNSNGNLTYSTYLGGTGADNGYGIAVDNNGNIYITGQTASSNFPTTDAYQTIIGGGSDAFLAIISSNAGVTAPVADFTATPTNGIAPLNVQFNDTSTGDIDNYYWDFNNDGTTDSTDKNPTWTYTISGTYTVKLTVSGPGGNNTITKTDYINVNNANRAPVLNPVGDKTVNENQNLNFTVSGTDPDNDPLTYTATNLPTGTTFNNNTFNWTPAFNQSGTYQVTFIVSDGSLTSNETITITVNNVNRAPVLNTIGNKTVNENQNLNFTVTGTDPDDDNLTYSATGLPAGATFTNDGVFNWTPTYTQNGTYTVTFTVSDGNLTDNQNITITVNNVNRAPVLNTVGNKTVNENQNLNFTVSGTDPDDDNLTYSASGLPAGATFNNDGVFNWTPTYTQNGTYQVTFTVSDGNLTDDETITIIIDNVNRAPVLNTVGNKSVNENQNLNFTVSGTDPDGDNLTYSASGLPAGATFNNGVFNWTPNYIQGGTYQVTFTVSDGNLTSDETITLTINNVNRAPVLISIGDKTVNENNSLNFTVMGVDMDGDNLTYSATGLPAGATFNNGVFNWTPTYAQSGIYHVTFTVSDGTLTDSKTISITVKDVDNVAPNVVKVDPAKNAVVKTAKNIKITFNEAIKLGTSAITLKNSSGTPLQTTNSISGNVLTITPKTTLGNGKYTLNLTTGVITDLTGNKLANYSTSFTVDSTAPKITKTDPTNGATTVAASKTIKATFNEAIKKGSNFWVELKNSSGKLISFSYSINGKVLTIDPKKNLAESLYTLVIHTGAVTDLAGNPVAAKSTKFSVGTAPKVSKIDPKSGATKVTRTKTIKLTFNEAIKAASGTKYWVELKTSSGKSVKISKSISGKVLSISHAKLAANTKYQLIIHTGAVTDKARNPIAAKTYKFAAGKT